MGKLFLTILILFFFNGCVMKEEYYSDKNSQVAQSSYNMKNRCYNCTKYIESSENQKSVIYLEDDIVYIEEVAYEDVEPTIVYVDENNYVDESDYEEVYYINEKSEKEEPTYSEEVIYYYEEEL